MTGREMEEVVSNATKYQVEITLGRELEELESGSVSTCIYKVPRILKDANKEAYMPKVISIGPYHCGTKNLHTMNSLKKRYLQCFLKRTGLELDTYFRMAQRWEKEVRVYYDEECHLQSDKLVKMILIDGIFIVEFIMQLCEKSDPNREGIALHASLEDDIMHDLMLLENQLPFFVLKGLYDQSNANNQFIINCISLIDQFHPVANNEHRHKALDFIIQLNEEDTGGIMIMHLVDLLHFIWVNMLSEPTPSTYQGPKLELSRSATELQEAGVKLKHEQDSVNSDRSTKVVFNKDGVLLIPPLVVQRHTESLFRNVIAYEQCHRKGTIFRSYVIFMDCLINTSLDVDLLVNSGIIGNSLGESEDVCTLFNHLYKMPMMGSREFHYAELCQKLNNYSRDPWHKWQATWFRWKLILRRDYFSSPWSICSVIAAFILLSLTIIQTLCSIKGVKW